MASRPDISPAAPGPAALLPAGLHDVLPPDAAREAAVIERVMATLAAHGYERVKPPLIEFEETLLSGPGAGLARDSFRLMDPISQRMMALRPDITPQVARVARTRLINAPRPLRLCYSGQVLRVRGGHLRPERQFAQVGAELLGADSPAADCEVAALAVEALSAIGVGRLSLDLNVPTLVPSLMAAHGLAGDRAERLRHALDRKDAAQVAALAGPAAPVLEGLLSATGPAGAALDAVAALELPGAASAALARLVEAVSGVRERLPDLPVTVDFVEHRGFEYQTGVSFTLFSRGVRGELGRGGRYVADHDGASAEPATGFTLFMDSVLRALPPAEPVERLYLPADTPRAVAADLRADGWVTVAGLAPEDDPEAEARRLGCGAVWVDGAVRRL
ncbi:MAG: ATP phosphoribosyltransferase regulatory subunit [Azospirillaceae bacterium]